jgi:hypothetical protein
MGRAAHRAELVVVDDAEPAGREAVRARALGALDTVARW